MKKIILGLAVTSTLMTTSLINAASANDILDLKCTVTQGETRTDTFMVRPTTTLQESERLHNAGDYSARVTYFLKNPAAVTIALFLFKDDVRLSESYSSVPTDILTRDFFMRHPLGLLSVSTGTTIDNTRIDIRCFPDPNAG